MNEETHASLNCNGARAAEPLKIVNIKSVHLFSFLAIHD